MKKIFSLVVASLVAGSAFADDLAEGVYYIKSASSDVYLTRGQAWGTQAVVEPYGHPWKVTLSEGKYKLQMYDIFTSGETVKSLGIEGYVDQSGDKVVGLDIAAGATEGSYSIAANGQFVSPNESNAIAYGATSYDWKFISTDEYKANQEAAIVAQEAAVAAEAGIDLTGTNLAAYLAENYSAKKLTVGFAPVPLSNSTDWTLTKVRVVNNQSYYNYGDYGFECYQGSGYMVQNLTGMTKGLYKIGIKAMQRSTSNEACFALGGEGYVNSGCYLDANGKIVNVKDWYSAHVDAGNPNTTGQELAIANNGGYYSEVYTYVGEDGKLDLAVKFPSFWTASWFIFNGIDIVYYLDKNSGTAALVEEFDGLVAQADSLLALPMAEDIKTALETAKVAPTEDSVDAYTEAINALKGAVAAALVSTKKYDNVPGHDVTSLATDVWTNQGNRYQGRIERWNDNTYVGDVLTQTLSGLVPGAVYELVIEASVCTTTERDNIAGAATGDGLTVVFANEGEVNAPCIAAVATENFPAYTVTGTVDKDGNLKFGIKNVQLGANWFTIRLISVTTKGNPTVDAYQTAQAAIAPVSEALAAADAAIADPNYTDIVATYRATLDGYVATTNSVIADVDSLFAEVALLPQVDSLVAALPTVEAINTLVTEFKAAVAASQHIAVKKAKLLHTASVCWGASPSQSLDGELAHYNNNSASTASNSWAGVAFAEFDFKGLNAKTITKATLTWKTITGGRANTNRNNKVYYLTPGTELPYDAMESASNECLFEDSRTLIETYVGMNTFVGTLDVIPAIEAALAAGKTNVIFQWTDNAAGADLVGIGQEDAPTLEIEFDMAPGLKVTPIEDFEAKALADYSADWTIGVADRFKTDFANRTLTDGKTSRYFTVTAAGTNGSTHTYNKITNTEDYQAAEEVVLDFDFAMSAIANGSGQNQSLTIKDAGGNTILVLNNHTEGNVQEIPSPIMNAAGDTIGYFDLTAHATVANYFYHVNVATSAAKTVLTMKDIAKDSVVATLDLAGGIHVGGLTYGTGKTYGMLALDEISYGIYTYAEIVEDPVFTPQGESYDTVFVAISTETEGATIKYTIDGGEEQTYEAPVELAQTATLAAWAEKNGSMSNVVSKKFIACVTPAPAITKAGQTYGADTVTITTEVPGAVIRYSIAEGDTLDYTDKFITDKTITVTAFAVYEGRPSEDVTLHVVAGDVKTPVVTLSSVEGAARKIAFATETATASIVYKLNDGAEVVGKQAKDTIAIEAETNIKVWARYVEGEKVFESAVVDTTFEAGATIQLAGVDIATEDYSAINQSADLKVSTSQLEVLLNPTVEIVWAYGETTGVAANGDVIKGVPVGATFTAYARAAGYVDSESSSVEVAPSYASTIFFEDYEDGTIGSWTAHSGWMPVNTAAADGTHFLHFYQNNQSGGRWAQLEFPEYSSTSYTLSFKIGIAAGNGGASVFKAYAGEDVFFTLETPTETGGTNSPGDRTTYVKNKDGEEVGSFTIYLKNRFEWADDKLASVDVTVSESGVVMTVVNPLGQTQVKTKISDVPVVITKFYEDFARSFGSFRMDDIKIAGRAGSVMAPEFALDHYDVINPAVAILDATDKTDIYYRAASTTYTIDEEGKIIAGEYTFPEEYTKYEGPVVFTNEATIIEAYAMYEGVVASPKSISPVYLSLTDLAAPTVAFAGVGEGAVRNFNVQDNTSELIDAAIFYQSIGATEADTLKETSVQTDSAAYGWFSVYAQVGELKSAVVNRYVDSRAVYKEPYVGFAGEGNAFPAAIADFEAGVGATIAGEYPTALIATTGTQYVHVAVTGKYAAFTLPFAFVVGTNVITNAQGDTLKLGEDYRILTLHTRNAQNTKNAADLATLVNAQNIESAVRAEGTNFSAGVAVMVEPLTEKVGNEVVLHSAEAAPIQVAATVTTVPTNGGYRLVANNRYENLALETPAYVLNEEGTKFVYTENPTLGALDAVIVIDPAKVADFGQEIDLVNASAIETLAVDAQVDNTYDLQGRKAQSVKEGLYIVNGKRIQVK